MSFLPHQVNEGVVIRVRFPGVSRSAGFGRVTERSPRAKQTAVAYGWDVHRSAASEAHSGGDDVGA